MKTAAPFRVCLLAFCCIWIFLTYQALAQDPNLTVDVNNGNSPFDSGHTYGANVNVVYNNFIVGETGQGNYTQDDGDSVDVLGNFIIADQASSSFVNGYDLGGDGTQVSLTADSLVFGNGGGIFQQASNTYAQLGTLYTRPGGFSEYFLGGGTLNTRQIGQTTGAAAGGFDFDGGILQAAASNANFMSNLSGAFVDVSGATVDSNGFNITISQILQGSPDPSITSGTFTKIGAGTLTLTGANSYPGTTAINGGVLNAGSATALGSGGAITFNGGTLQYSAASAGVDFSSRFSSAGNQAISLDTNGQNVTIGNGFSGTGTSLTKLGAGILTINGGNTYTGATNLDAGTVTVDNPSALGSGGTIVLNGGILQYGDTSHSDGSYNAADYSARFSTASGQNYNIDTNGHNIVYNTALVSSGGVLVKTGTGTLTLNGNNTYSGITKVNAGTLLLNGTNTGGGNVAVQNTGSVLGGTGNTTAAVSVDYGTINPGGNSGAAGSSANVGNLRVGSLTLDTHSILSLDVNSATTYDVLTSNGNVRLGGAALTVSLNPNATFAVGQTLDLIHLTSGALTQTFTGIANGGTYAFGGTAFTAEYTSTDFELVVAVPEPATWLLLALPMAIGGASIARRRRAARKLAPAVGVM